MIVQVIVGQIGEYGAVKVHSVGSAHGKALGAYLQGYSLCSHVVHLLQRLMKADSIRRGETPFQLVILKFRGYGSDVAAICFIILVMVDFPLVPVTPNTVSFSETWSK